MVLTVHQLSTSSPTMDFQFLCQLAQLHSARAVHVSTHSESLAPKYSSIQWLWLPEMLWEWGMQVHLWLLVCDATAASCWYCTVWNFHIFWQFNLDSQFKITCTRVNHQCSNSTDNWPQYKKQELHSKPFNSRTTLHCTSDWSSKQSYILVLSNDWPSKA